MITSGLFVTTDGHTLPASRVDPATLVELLRWRAHHQPDQRAYTFLLDGETEEASLTYAELDRQVRGIAALLQSCTDAGERALLLYPPGLDYIAAFFGCLYAGVVAVPAYPPQSTRVERTLPRRLRVIAQDARPGVALVTLAGLQIGEALAAHDPAFGTLRWLATDHLADGLAESWQEPGVASETLAFLQYTSGSTAMPKGVMLTHGNLLHNSLLIQHCFETTPDSRGLIWLPPYHDMGLIGGILQPLYTGCPVTLMSPIAFLQQPLRWLQAISRYHATTSGGPNFAYDLCARRITPEQRATLDLSSWQVAFNGAEPIRSDTLERFAAAFAPCGFRREAFYPCYGLAEATLLVSGGRVADPPIVGSFSAAALEQNRVAEAQAGVGARTLIGCGRDLPDQQIVIANPQTRVRCRPDEIGEIWVAGPGVAQGYWGRPDETERAFQAYLAGGGAGPFLRTGDLGFIHGDELFVTGRLKDVIIIRGRNHYPQDIELTVEQSHPALRPGCGAAFSVEVNGEERLVVAQEVERQHRRADVDDVAAAVRRAVAAEHELQVYAVLLLRPGSIPKTSSGKLQRHACRVAFLAGTLDLLGSSMLDESRVVDESDQGELTREALLALPVARRQARLATYLRAHVARVLQVDPSRMDPQQPISALGLDSLMAVELQHTIETDLQVAVPMAGFLQGASTIDLAAEVLGRLMASPAGVQLVPSHEAARQPLSAGQRALWLLQQLAPESAAYNIASAARIRGALDVPALHRAFQQLIMRHPSLRTTFTQSGGEPLQQVCEQAEACFIEQDATGWSAATLDERLIAAAHESFDLQHEPLLRVHLFTRSASEHVLLVVVHHIVADLWSLAVMTRELAALYPAEAAGTSTTLPTSRLRYTDYVCWQEQMLAGPEGERLWTYWRRQLAGAPMVLNLPADRPRPPAQTYRGAARTFTLSPQLNQRIKAVAEAGGATPYMALLAAFAVLLYRYTGQDDILIGSPTAGRSQADLAAIVGYFVNPVVLRTKLSGNPPFLALLQHVRDTTLAAFEHQDYPFVRLVERLQPARDLSYSPLFQVMFAWQKAPGLDHEGLAAFALGEPGSQMNVGGLCFESLALEQRVAQFDLSLAMADAGDRLAGSLEYNADLFDAATIERMVDHLETLLEAIGADPTTRIAELLLLPAAERRRILEEWNATADRTPGDSCVHELFEAQAARTPAAVAVAFEEERLTYGELNRRANRLAHHLRRLGVGPEVLVGICVERSPEMMAGILGILKAGGAYLPLDPAYPPERLQWMLRDAQAPLLLTQERLLAGLPPHGARVICLDRDWASIAREDAHNTVGEASTENIACAIYTSGSTGRPKGVLIRHSSIANLIASFVRSYSPEAHDSILPLTSLSSASFAGEIFPLLCTGGALVLPNAVEVFDYQALCALIARHNVSIVSTVPSVIALLNARKEALPRLRLILSGGEELALGDIDRLLPSVTIANGYGLTETTICSTFYHLVPADVYLGGNVPIGRPVLNTHVYILDSHLHPMPIGCPGELYIAGAGLARGYFNHPELTAERFIPDPYTPGERMYRTGDLARWLPTGVIEYLGRIDRQVKIRGFRVEPSEIEATLRGHPALREAVIVVREETPGDKRLVAYAVPAQEHTLTIAELRGWLKERLPDYMLPAAFMLLRALPLTPNGKVDRRALPVPDSARPEPEVTYMAPRGELERKLAAVWQAALKVEKVGIHDNFFDLGGHSLMLVQVHNELRESFDQLALIDMFKYPTISALAAYLSAERHEPAEAFQEIQDRARKQRQARDWRKQSLRR